MNRIAALGPQLVAKKQKSPQPSNFISADHAAAPHSLVGPLHYEPNYAYPLIVWLHGPGGNDREIRQVMPLISSRNYVAIAPRAATRVPGRPHRFSWSDAVSSPARVEQAVFDCIDVARKQYNVSLHRVFLAGRECGGTTALRLALAHPESFAGAISLGGPFPSGNAPLAKWHSARRVPILMARGCDAIEAEGQSLRSDLRLLNVARLKTTVRLYPGDDSLTTVMLDDMNHWIMEQVTGCVCDRDDRDAVPDAWNG